MNTRTLILGAVAFLCFSTAGFGQSLKIGFVDSQKIFEGMPEAQKVQKDLDARLKVWQDSLDAMSKSFQAQYESYQQQQGMMSEAAKKDKQQELLKLQTAVQEYQNEKFGQRGEAAQLRAKMLQPLQDKVLRVIDDLAKKEKLNFVFDKIQDASNILYADSKFDYTNLVLDMLKRGSN